jgi:hypothetical protein
VLQYLGQRGWNGSLVAEVATRGAGSRADRLAMLTETVSYARAHVAIGRTRRQSTAV